MTTRLCLDCDCESDVCVHFRGLFNDSECLIATVNRVFVIPPVSGSMMKSFSLHDVQSGTFEMQIRRMSEGFMILELISNCAAEACSFRKKIKRETE